MSSTMLQLVSQVTTELGLPIPASVAGNSSQDATQILGLLNAVGYEVQREHQWQGMTKEYRFTTVFYNYTGDVVTGSRTISNMSSTAGLNSNFMVTGTGINQDTYVSSTSSSNVYANYPGASGDYMSTPDSPALSITGDISFVIRVAMADWTPSVQKNLIDKWKNPGVGNDLSYLFTVATNGKIQISLSQTGSTAPTISASSVPTGITDGDTAWLLCTVDVNNGSGGADIKYYTAADGATTPALATFTQLGTTVTLASPISIFDSSQAVNLGANYLGTSNNLDGKIYRAQIYNGLYGSGFETLAADFNGQDATVGASSVTSVSTGETWTLHGTVSITSTGSSAITISQPAASSATAGAFTFSQTKYPMPSDFDRLIDATDWDKSKHWQLLGPETAQQWQWLKSGYTSTGPRIRFRPLGDYFQIWPPLGAADYLGFEYMSTSWVLSATAQSNGVTPDQTSFTADTDKSIFPDRLLVLGTKLKYFEIKGFDTISLYRDYQRHLDLSKANDAGSPNLAMAPRPANQLIGWTNIPDSGYGT